MIDFYLGINHLELVGAVCAAVLVVFPLLKLSICGVRKQIGRLSLYAKILLGFCIVNSVIVCGTKTNDPPRSAGAAVPVRDGAGRSISLAAFPVSDGAGRTPVATAIAARSARGIPISLVAFPVMVAPEDIVRGYRVVSVATNETPFAEMPSNAVEYAKWSLRGGYETWFPLDLGEFVFPLGTNFVNRFRVVSGGMVETYPALNGPASICAAREYALLIPGVSRFWSADADDGAKVLRWENVFANRNRTGEYSAEMRLFPNGDFSTRSNEVETVFRRVNPYDWDGDGIANEIDNNPQICDGDFFGIANQLPTNANPNTYYWLDLAATGALGVAKISVVCDGPSDLGDHSIIVRTNQVCHIPLLAGATYTVESDLPIGYSTVSSEYAQIETNSEKRLSVILPLEISFERIQTRSGSDNYTAHTSPIDVGPRIDNISGGCCNCVTNDFGFSWVCGGNCYCGGYWHPISTTAVWGGYSRLFDWSGWCPCIWHDDWTGQQTGSPRLVLDMPRTLFTNKDGSAEPSDIVRLTAGLFSPVATNGTLTLDAFPREFVAIWQNSNRSEQVSLPLTWDVEETPCKVLYVEGLETIGRNFASLELKWRDSNDVQQMSDSHDFAIYSPNLNVINNTLFDNGDLCNPSGIVTGTNACFALEFDDATPPSPEIVWSIVEGDAQFVGGNTGERVRVASGIAGQRVTLQAQIDDCRSRPPTVSAFVVEPLAVKLTVWIVGNDFGTYYATDAASVSNLVAGANKIYEQIGVSFYVDSVSFTNKESWLDISRNRNHCDFTKRRELVNSSHDSGGLEIYFVDRVAEGVSANHDVYGIVMSKNANALTLAHELGHAFGCADVYSCMKHQPDIHIPDSVLSESHAPLDWNNGTGCRYYRVADNQELLIERLLMCGNGEQDRRDISSGSIYGFTEDGDDGLVDVGFFRSGVRRGILFHR